MDEVYEVYALKYGERVNRTRALSFIADDDHASPHPIDYFIWLIRNENRTVVVDTGYDDREGRRRDRPVMREPCLCLKDFGVDPDTVETVVVTHLHYDHAGTLDRFPAAHFHLQAAEMAYATGPCMCHAMLKEPFTADHVCEMVKKVYSGRVVFHDGDGLVAPGIEVKAIGGHSRGLQAVRVKTSNCWLVLASDATHYYENYLLKKPFPIVADVAAMLDGFTLLPRLASSPGLVIPGHDPLVRTIFAKVAGSESGPSVHRLDTGPAIDPKTVLPYF